MKENRSRQVKQRYEHHIFKVSSKITSVFFFFLRVWKPIFFERGGDNVYFQFFCRWRPSCIEGTLVFHTRFGDYKRDIKKKKNTQELSETLSERHLPPYDPFRSNKTLMMSAARRSRELFRVEVTNQLKQYTASYDSASQDRLWHLISDIKRAWLPEPWEISAV